MDDFTYYNCNGEENDICYSCRLSILKHWLPKYRHKRGYNDVVNEKGYENEDYISARVKVEFV